METSRFSAGRLQLDREFLERPRRARNVLGIVASGAVFVDAASGPDLCVNCTEAVPRGVRRAGIRTPWTAEVKLEDRNRFRRAGLRAPAQFRGGKRGARRVRKGTCG